MSIRKNLYIFSLFFFCLLLHACKGCERDFAPPVADTTTDQTDISSADQEDIPQIICTPGEIKSCREENTPGVNRCNTQGTGYEPSSCSGVQVCRADACVAVACIPKKRRCLGSGALAIPQQCDDAGNVFEDLDVCDPGFLCEEGFCLNRCAIAERTGSYIGCEYWAVELENHLLYEGGSAPLTPNNMPPFAVVLANMSSTYDAEITVFDDDATFANAVPSRLVQDKRPEPGNALVTVYSELVDAQGDRIKLIDGPIDKIPLPRGTIMTLILPHNRLPFGETSLKRSGFKIISSQPVVAYQFNPLCCNYNTTNDASLLLPKGALTEHYMFMSSAVFAGTSQGRLNKVFSPTLTVIATESDTDVTVTLNAPKGLDRPYHDLVYPPSDSRITGPDERGILSVRLQPFEVFNVGGRGKNPVEDLTGARIVASKPVAVFGGHSCANVPFNHGFCDHLESQLFPVETWGRRFILAPLKVRAKTPMPNSREATYWKFLAREDRTEIDTKIDLRHNTGEILRPAGENTNSCVMFSDEPELGKFTLDAGESCEFGTRKTLVALANKPVMIGAFISGQNTVKKNSFFGDFAGDPAFFLIPPEEQYRTNYSFLTPKTYHFSYVTVTTSPGNAIMLDGQPIDITQFDYEQEPETGFVRAHLPLEPGPHDIEGQLPFGIIVYGYDDYVSYAFTGGMNLTKLTAWQE